MNPKPPSTFPSFQRVVARIITDPAEQAAIDERCRQQRHTAAWVIGLSNLDELIAPLPPEQLLALVEYLIDQLPPAELGLLEQSLRKRLGA